ncbi:MAG: hypothetical protein ACFB0D_22470 [Phormidesmis sp.]
MSQTERLVMLAEDQLVEYSTDARKVEKLRQKIALSVPIKQLQPIKEEIEAEVSGNFFNKVLLEQRQAVALPFWGIAGLGLLFGISFTQPVDFLATGIGGALAIIIQRRGWKLQAKDLVLQAIAQIEDRTQAAKNQKEAEKEESK